ncbi:MAG: Imm40 family immunity protein [Chitinophagaceae bacterium]
MESISNYLDFIKLKGRPVLEVNPGSDEIALTVEDALHGLELLKISHTEIFGGDVYSEDNGLLIYAYQLWGAKYHYLNWYCDRMDNEREDDYLKRSYEIASEGISNASKTAEQLKKKCFFVLVTGWIYSAQ